ncbi:MAG: N-acetyltransferase family protein, partial [Pacificimonas sp.]
MAVEIRTVDDADLPAILGIVNDAILNSTAWYDERPRNLGDQRDWLAAKRAGGWPVFVAEDAGGVIGFSTFDVFRGRPAYTRTAEHSVYVGKAARGRGAGRLLLEALVAEAAVRDLHVLVGGVDSENTGSLAFHEAMGFVEVGRLPQVGFKFGRWLTLVFMHKI